MITVIPRLSMALSLSLSFSLSLSLSLSLSHTQKRPKNIAPNQSSEHENIKSKRNNFANLEIVREGERERGRKKILTRFVMFDIEREREREEY